jgi:hypothetical protein
MPCGQDRPPRLTQRAQAEHTPTGLPNQQLPKWAATNASCNLDIASYDGSGTRATASGQRTPRAGGQHPRPTPTSVRLELKGDVAVDALQVMLGEVLLALTGLAVVLLAVILVLAEAHLILRLARTLTQNVSDERGGR